MKYLFIIAVLGLFAGNALATEPEPIPELVYGCTISGALNFNPLANTNDGSCKFISGNSNPLFVGQPFWGGITGFQIQELYVGLRPGERLGDEYCLPWFSPDVFGIACWTKILR